MAEDPGDFAKIEFNTTELPPSVEIRESSVISGQAGAFSKTVISKDTKFGPYKGEVINAGQKDYIDYRYAWEVFEKDSNVLRYTISALDPKTSNWMRHVNCARFYEEQNILSIQEEYSIFYVAMKNIKPGEELLTWFDPKLLKRTKRRLSKMGRKPVGYTIELVPWSDEKKFVPEIIETKRKRKKKVLSDMISLDENPLVMTRTLQSLPKIPCTPKQIAQSSFKGTFMAEHRNVSLKTSRATLPASAPLVSKAKKGSKPPSQTINVPQKTENKQNENVTVRSSTETCKHLQEGTDKFRCTSLNHASPAEGVEKQDKKVLCSQGGALKVPEKKVNKNMLLKKSPIKLGRARLQFSTHRELFHVDATSVKPVVVKQHEDGSISVEDHDETYILNNMELRPECDDTCPCLNSNKSVRTQSSVTDKQDTFVIHFTLLPEHKSLSPNNKIIYRCDVCDSAYNHAFSLKRHYLSVHVNHRYLSRDDILSCQIETFHMDIEHHTENSEIETDTLLKDSESSALKMQSAVTTTRNVSSSGEAEMSVHCTDKQRKAVVEECKDNDKENISSEVKKAVNAQQFPSVPSLKHLAQISLCKTRGITNASCSPVSLQKLCMICNEVKNESCVTDNCASSEGNESVSPDLPCQLESGMDCVLSKQNYGTPIANELSPIGLNNCCKTETKHIISGDLFQSDQVSASGFDKLNGDISQESPCVHSDIENPGSDILAAAITVQEDYDHVANQIITNDNLCGQASEHSLDLNPSRLEQHDNKQINSLNKEVALDIPDPTDLIASSECELQSDTLETGGDLLVKTIAEFLKGCDNTVEKVIVEESRDFCQPRLNKQALTNHSEASADSTVLLVEETHDTAVRTSEDCAAETERAHDMKPDETIFASSVSDLSNLESDCVKSDLPNVESDCVKSDVSNVESDVVTSDLSNVESDGVKSDLSNVESDGVTSDLSNVEYDVVKSDLSNVESDSVTSDLSNVEYDVVKSDLSNVEYDVVKSDLSNVESDGVTSDLSNVEYDVVKSDLSNVESDGVTSDLSNVEYDVVKSDLSNVESDGVTSDLSNVEYDVVKSDLSNVEYDVVKSDLSNVESDGVKSNLSTVESDSVKGESHLSNMESDGVKSDLSNVESDDVKLDLSHVESDGVKSESDLSNVKSDGIKGESDLSTVEFDGVKGESGLSTVESDGVKTDLSNVEFDDVKGESGLSTVESDGVKTDLSDVEFDGVKGESGLSTVESDGVKTDLSNVEFDSVTVSTMDSHTLPGETIPQSDASSDGATDNFDVTDSYKCPDHSSTASSPPATLSEEFPANLNDVSPPVDISTTVGAHDSVSPVSFFCSDVEVSESLQNIDILTSSVKPQTKQERLDGHLPENDTVQTTVESSTTTTTSTSVIQSPSAQKLIFVTNLVFPVVSPPHKAQNSSSSVSQGPSSLTTKTSQSASVPLVVISQVPCGLNIQNATNAFLPSSTALKALQTMKNSFSVLNFGNNPSGLSLSVLPSGSKSSISPSSCDKILLENSLPLSISASTTTATSLISCSPLLPEQTTEKSLKPGLNLCAPFATISSLVLGGAHLSVSSSGSTKCTTSPTMFPLSSISSLISMKNNATLVDGQPDDLYRCHMCVRVFRTMNELKLHIRNDPHRFKGGIKQYACQQCSMRFSNKNNLMRHNLMNHPESENYKFRCYTCGKGFMCETYLKMHARFHSGRNFPCKYGCVDVYFPNAAALVKHLRTQHPGLNLKEYLRNAKASKSHGRKLSCLLRTTVEENTGFGAEGTCLKASQGHSLETSQSAVNSTFPYSLAQPGVGFQAKRGRFKGLNKTAAMFPGGEDNKMIDEGCEFVPDTQESSISTDDSCRLRYVCSMCTKRFCSHLRLLRHKTQQHGASESVQEYLYQMSKETSDEEMSDTGVKLDFSPPPSPKTFFEKVNERGFENMSYYIDGNKESLKFWQKHFNLRENTDPVLTSAADKKLEWTTFNFPPCFEYREDCTTFYDSITKPGTSPKLLVNPTEDHKEKGTCEAHCGLDVSSAAEVNAIVDTFKPEPMKESCLQGAPNILRFADDTICSKDNSNCANVYEQGLVGTSEPQKHVSQSQHKTELNMSSSNVTETVSCAAERITLDQNKRCPFVNHVAQNKEERYSLLEESKVEGTVSEVDVSGTLDNFVSNREAETDSQSICRCIVNEVVDRAMLVQESTQDEKCNSHRSDSLLDGNSNLKTCSCEAAQPVTAVDDLGALPDIEVKVDIKQEVSTEHVQEVTAASCEPFSVADILQTFTELPAKDKLALFKSHRIQGLDLVLSEHNHSLFLEKVPMARNKSVSYMESWSPQSLIGALDLHRMNECMSSEVFNQVAGGVLKQSSSVVKKKALSLESLVLWPSNKSGRHFDPALHTALNNSDTSKHDHRRYSIWARQVHQTFDNAGKDEMFCQPVTEAVRKQEVMREKAQYNFEKSIRDKEMHEKHEKFTQKMSFAESLGLMSRNEFEMSYHARKQQQYVIKVPEVWNNYENIWFGKKGNITVVCSVCHRHFSCWDLCLRHQLKKHPHIEPASLEMERDNYVEDMYYYYPMPYGILAQTHLIPDNLPVPEVYVCIRCGFPFKNLNRLHAHIIICDPAQEEACSSQNNGVKKVSYMKKKLLPMMDRRLHQQMEQPKMKISKSSKNGVDASLASAEIKNSKSFPANGKTSKPTQHTSDNKLVASAVQSRSSYSPPFSYYSGKKGKNYELLYNPQNHTRRREMYKILDQHQCHGCNLKFNSLSMLERHVNKCSGKDKLQNQKPLLSGIMPDDAALRKQHTCRYCGKRFTYIKGVDLHYKRICAVRKVKEEENQLTEEDLAHEEELKRIIEHIKWSKSLSKDSSDIIQGHVRVEEDGTLTRVVKQPEWSQALKKKVKKKGTKWTALKRHRPDDDFPSASSASSSNQSSPVVGAENMKSPLDEKVPDKSNILDVAGQKRLTRSAGHEGLHQNNGINNKRHASTDRNSAGKKAKTGLKSVSVNSCSKTNSSNLLLTQSKTDGNCNGVKGKSKKLACNEVKGVSESRQNKSSKDTVKNNRVNASHTGSPAGTRNKTAASTVPPAGSAPVCIKPPARKRGTPKRFDPSDMESSYKKKKKDEEFIFEQTKPDSGGRKRNTNSGTKQKANTTAKGNDVCQSSHVLRKTSSRSSLDSSSSTSTSKVSVNKHVSSNKEEESKMIEKMKKLKEAAKSESRKSNQKRKLPVSMFTNYVNKKSDTGDKNDKKCDTPMNKVSATSELFKHLTKSEQILHEKTSPQKSVSNRKRTVSVDSAGDVNNYQASGKRVKITTNNSNAKSPVKPTVSLANNATVSPGSKCNKAAQKYPNKSGGKCKASDQEAPTVAPSSSAANVSPDCKRALSKPTSPVSKQPMVTFKVVTLSPNGCNLLTYDSSADVPQSSLLLTKPGKVASHSPTAQQILKCLPQRPIQFVTKSSGLLQGIELQKANHEQGMKVISTENLGLSHSAVHRQAISTLIITEGDNLRIKKPISQVCNQGHVSQKDFLCQAPCSPDVGKLKDAEKHGSHNVRSDTQDGFVIQGVVDNNSRDNEFIGEICEGQIMLSSTESSLITSANQTVPKQSLKHDLQKSSKSDITSLCHVDQLFKKQSDISTADENLSAGQNQVVVSSVSSVLTKPGSQCQKRQTLSEQTKSEICKIVQSVSQAHAKPSNMTSVKSPSFSTLHVANSVSPTNSHEPVSAIIVPSTSVKVHVTVPHSVSTTAATRFTFPSRFRSPTKVVTVTGTVLPHLSQGGTVQTATKILKLGGVNVKNASVSPAPPQTPDVTAHFKQIPNTASVVPKIVTQKPLVLNAGQLPRLLTMGARHQHPNTQVVTPGALRQSVLNIAANQTSCATQILPGRCLSKTVSPQICIPQSSLVNNIVSVTQPLSVANVTQPLSVANVGTPVSVNSLKTKKTSNISLVAAPSSAPACSQIMFSLDDGTTAMLDPDSLAQFLTVSPSLNKSELYSTAPAPKAVQEYKSPLVLNITENQSNHQNIGEINWPANGTVDLTDLSDTVID